MRTFKRIMSVIPMCILWVVMSSIVWGFIFNIITDTAQKNKVVVFIEADNVRDGDFAELLETEKPDGIKMIKVHPFSYAMFGSDEITRADVFIVKGENVGLYAGAYAECVIEGDYEYCVSDGVRIGIKVYDKNTKNGAAADYIEYGDDDYYIMFGAKSVHIDDGAAADVAKIIINLDKEG